MLMSLGLDMLFMYLLSFLLSELHLHIWEAQDITKQPWAQHDRVEPVPQVWLPLAQTLLPPGAGGHQGQGQF